jgi:2,3-bisphosphoglycerate-independent phosphoglycerate mutase
VPKQHYFRKWIKDLVGNRDGKVEERHVEKFLDELIAIKNNFQVMPNTGYCLLVIDPTSEQHSRIKITNPHQLPTELFNSDDGTENSKRALHAAIDGLAYNLLSLDRSFSSLRDKAISNGIKI